MYIHILVHVIHLIQNVIWSKKKVTPIYTCSICLPLPHIYIINPKYLVLGHRGINIAKRHPTPHCRHTTDKKPKRPDSPVRERSHWPTVSIPCHYPTTPKATDVGVGNEERPTIHPIPQVNETCQYADMHPTPEIPKLLPTRCPTHPQKSLKQVFIGLYGQTEKQGKWQPPRPPAQNTCPLTR